MPQKKALIMVDLQNDFCPGGRLPVPNGDEVIRLANQLQPCFDLIIATQDWHPNNHIGFVTNHPGAKIGEQISIGEVSQVLWPVHCEQGTKGAEFHSDLVTHAIANIVRKGVDPSIDSYSAFFDNAHLRSTGLADYLQSQGIKDVYIMGLATDYCVKYSVLDALALGFHVFVIADACRGVELTSGDIARSYAEMQQAGAKIIHSADILK